MCRDIISLPGYEANELGEILKDGKVLKQVVNGRGYYRVFVVVAGKKTSRQVHRLIAETFLDNPLNLPLVNHINGDKLDNSLSNLEWETYQGNSQKALELNARERKPIAKITKTGKVRDVFLSINQAAISCGLSYRSLFEAVKNNKPYKGFRWRYCKLDILLEDTTNGHKEMAQQGIQN